LGQGTVAEMILQAFLKTVSDSTDVTFCGGECSTVGKWRPEKLGRQLLKVDASDHKH